MKIYSKLIYSVLVLMCVFGCAQDQVLSVKHSNPDIVYNGRIDSSQVNGTKLFWSGTSIKINFEGSAIAVLLEDDLGDNYYNVILDQDSMFILRPDTIRQYYALATDLSKGAHTIEIFKRTEWDRGTTIFYGFQIQGKAKLLPRTAPQNKSIEFYGNSITAGYAVEDTSGKDSPDSTYTNNYVSYAAITGRHFDAEYQCICRSGIGIMVSWFPLIMPELYNRLDPNDSTRQWDFSLYQPDVVVVNLFQNDSWIIQMIGSDEFKLRFGESVPSRDYILTAYEQFISNLRKHYPQANIICSLGCMDAAKEGSKWIDIINEAVSNLDDPKIHSHIMPYIEANAHPSIQDQEEMASSLIQFIEREIGW